MRKVKDQEELLRIAVAAQIYVDKAAEQGMIQQINEVLDFCSVVSEFKDAKIDEFVWEKVPATARREDIPVVWADRDLFMEQAPLGEGDFFKVPQLMSEV